MEEDYGRGFGKDYALSQGNLWPLYEQMVAEAGGEGHSQRDPERQQQHGHHDGQPWPREFVLLGVSHDDLLSRSGR